MQGFVTIYINRDDYNTVKDETVINLVKKHSIAAFDKSLEAGFPIVLVTTTDEATRAEKIDFDKPFPIKPPRGTVEYDEMVAGLAKEDQMKNELTELKKLVEGLVKEDEDGDNEKEDEEIEAKEEPIKVKVD
jgi:hypothetical protein